MTEKQKKWIEIKKKRLDDVISILYPMREYEMECINIMINEMVKQDARGSEQVRSEMLDIIEKWEVKRINDERNRKQNIQ